MNRACQRVLVGWVSCVLGAGSISIAAGERASGLSFTHHDWELACDNTRTCRAAGYQADDDGRPVSVLLTRKAGPAQPVTGELMLGYYDESPGVASVRLRIGDDGHGELVLDEHSGIAALSADQVTALLRALRRDSRIVFEGPQGNDRWRLSDRGASAVLLKMDEVQGRIGTTGALARRGDADESAVLPALPTPVLRSIPLLPARDGDADIAKDPVLLAALRASVDGEDCAFSAPEATDAELSIIRLGETSLLVSAHCWLAAYNSGRGYWVVDDQPPYRPRLVTTMATDFEEGQIIAQHKGRGLGDCWSSSSWVWDGSDFVKAGEATTGMCRLVAPGGTWHLPTRVSDIAR